MRLVSIDKIQVGESLGYPIRSQDGKILLKQGAAMTQRYINHLKGHRINGVYVDDELFDEADILPAVSEDTKTFAMGAVSKAFQDVSKKLAVSDQSIRTSAKSIAEDVFKRIKAPINLYNLYAIDDQRVLHAVNTAIITAALSYFCSIPLSKIHDYVTAALVHDITLEKFDKNDYSHAESSAEYLKSMRTFSNLTCASVAMHHERFDGTGGPKGFEGESIFEGARILAVADQYDRLHYGLGCNPHPAHLAVEYLNTMSGTVLDPNLLVKFSKCIAIYPTGATVLLNNGLRAIVITQNEGMPTRPVVKLLMPQRENCIEFNMLTNNTIFIEDVDI